MICKFYLGKGLISVSTPNSVTLIDNWAFTNCESLTSVVMESAIPPKLGVGVFDGTNECLQIYVLYEAVNAYKTAKRWDTYKDQIHPISEYNFPKSTEERK